MKRDRKMRFRFLTLIPDAGSLAKAARILEYLIICCYNDTITVDDSDEDFYMKLIADYSMPIAAALLLAVFFLSLPDLKTTPLPDGDKKRRVLTRADALIMALITLVYGAVAFYRLGDTKAPQSFENMENNYAVIELPDEEIYHLSFYTGIGIGSYQIDYSADGEHFEYLTSFTQSHADDLKWHNVVFDSLLHGGVIHIFGTGNVWLGEVVFTDGNGVPVQITADKTTLCDEQALYQPTQTYMNSSYFDEIYHARTAWEHLNNINPYEITHPPLGKLIISVGIALFGMTPFGWRFSGTLFGVLMLPIMYVFLKKLFGGKAVPAAGTVVFASDFMHFVQTRISTIDTYAVFFILLMYLFMYLFFTEHRLRDLALSGLFFGLGAASKWTCLYAGAGLALIWAWYWVKNARLGLKAFLKNCGFCLLFFVLLPCGIYYLAYLPYGRASGYALFSGEYLQMVLDNQEYMFNYHSGVVATHPYSSRWYQWILDIRPILYYLQYLPNGMRSSFGAFVNPALCWGGFMALFVLLYLALARRDETAAFILLGYLAQLVPWMFVSRLTFAYHYFPCTVFLVLAMGYVFSIFCQNGRHGRRCVWGFALGSLALFALFYPALSGAPVNNALATRLLGWLPSWPF